MSSASYNFQNQKGIEREVNKYNRNTTKLTDKQWTNFYLCDIDIDKDIHPSDNNLNIIVFLNQLLHMYSNQSFY